MNLETIKPLEPLLIPDWVKKAGLEKCFIFKGNSMLPTLTPGQLIYIRKGIADIHAGDVIVYKGAKSDRYTVHRIKKKSGSGWILRGDNNSKNDPLTLPPEQIIGRVELVETHNRLKKVKGGKTALWKARIRWGLRILKKRIPGFVKNIYKYLRNSRIVSWTLNKYLNNNIKIVHFQTPYGLLIKTTYKGNTVASWIEGHDVYYCKKPFDLILKRNDIMKKMM